MTSVETAVVPYGEWPSPITADHVAAGSGGLTWPSCRGPETWWCSSDPETATVQLLRCLPGRPPAPVLPGRWSIRNELNGYGGRPYLVVPGVGAHQLVFTEHSDRRVYALQIGPLDGARVDAEPTPLTPVDHEDMTTVYAEPVLSHDACEVWCVREVTRASSGRDDDDPAPRTTRDVVAIPLDGSGVDPNRPLRVVAGSHHFLAGIRISPDGARLAWIGWDHPAMPWDHTDVMVADLEDGVATGARRVLGDRDISIPQVEWDGAHALYAMADPDGWWNLHRITLDEDPQVDCVLPLSQECADALWKVGSTWFVVTPAGVVLSHGVGDRQLSVWDPRTGALRELATGWSEFGSYLGGTTIDDPDPHVAAVAGSPEHEGTVLRIPVRSGEPVACTSRQHAELDPWNPVAERRIALGADGREVHYVYYPPTHPEVIGPVGSAPPLLVHVHGGPTGSTGATPDLEFGLFCSRGFAVASVDYGGSTGYGRAYRNRLQHRWGIVDVEDSVAVRDDLVKRGLADSVRTAVRGGSAGGWTSLACLATTDAFCAGAVYYPISDPLHWSGGATHDFESHYLQSLIGILPEDRARYEAVSPLANADRIRSPLVMLQGADDSICRPEQAQRIVDAVSARGLWHRYLVFDGEGHGFRKHSSVAQSLHAEFELYSRTMGVRVTLAGVDNKAEGNPVS